MQPALDYKAIRTTKAYDDLLNALYLKAQRKAGEIEVPPVRVIAVSGNEPPGTGEYQDAIAVLYGIGYGLKMGLKFGKLPQPKGYFDYRVGALGTFWWSTGQTLEINDPTTLRWQAYLMVPGSCRRSWSTKRERRPRPSTRKSPTIALPSKPSARGVPC